nr:MAG TPA: hypothetical protein [Caudoviricetes sp.]
MIFLLFAILVPLLSSYYSRSATYRYITLNILVNSI